MGKALENEGGPSFQQIASPKPADWPTYHGNTTGNRHSALNEINTANVRNLQLKWVFPIDHQVLEGTPPPWLRKALMKDQERSFDFEDDDEVKS